MLEEGLGRLAPKEARLQLARRPLIIGVASSQAAFAASASLNVTYNVITMIMMIFPGVHGNADFDELLLSMN